MGADATTAAGQPLRELAKAHGLKTEQMRFLLKATGVRPVGSRREPGPFAARAVSLWDAAAVADAVARSRPPGGWLTLRGYAAAKGLSHLYVSALWQFGQLVGGLWGGRVYVDPDAARLPRNPAVVGVKNARKPEPVASAGDPADGEGEPRDGRRNDDEWYGPEVPFGPSGLLLYQGDLDFLARVRERRANRGGR
jgi:hypothetical protein